MTTTEYIRNYTAMAKSLILPLGIPNKIGSTMDTDSKELLAVIQAQIRRGEELSEDELREYILIARQGRRSAAESQKKARKAPAEAISLTMLFQRAAKAEGIETS